jgi:hypothetical protein
MTPRHLKRELAGAVPYEIRAWRSLSPRFMQWFIRPGLAGRTVLSLIYRLEDAFPRFFGLYGQYPMIVLHKTAETGGAWGSAAESGERSIARAS